MQNGMLGELIESLEGEKIKKIVLFGSHAYGTPSPQSDVDLYIVTADPTIPADYEAHRRIYLRVARKLRDLRRRYPIDLIVHTEGMYRKFVALGSSFAKKIENEGVVLYES